VPAVLYAAAILDHPACNHVQRLARNMNEYMCTERNNVKSRLRSEASENKLTA